MAVTPTEEDLAESVRQFIASASGIDADKVSQLHQPADASEPPPYARFVPITDNTEGSSSPQYASLDLQAGSVTERRGSIQRARYQVDFFGDADPARRFMLYAEGYDAKVAARKVVPSFSLRRIFDLRQIDFGDEYQYGGRRTVDFEFVYAQSEEFSRALISDADLDVRLDYDDIAERVT